MLRFSDRFKQQTARWLGITRQQVESVVRQADAEQRVEIGPDAYVRLATKLWDDPKRPRTWLVALSRTPAHPETVFEALPIPTAVLEVDGEPLDLFRAVCERVGLELQVGDVRGRFIEQASVRLEGSGGEAIRLINPPMAVGIRQNHMMNVQPPLVHVAFAYAFPEDALTRFILAKDH